MTATTTAAAATATTTTTRWWWIRHAPVTIYDGRVYGQTDVPGNTSDGEAFAALAGSLPDGAQWVVSNLRRTHDTAKAVAGAGLSIGEWVAEAALAEQHFGDWQGQDRREVFRKYAEWHGFWLAPADTAPPGGESFVDLWNRVAPAIDRLSRDYRGRDIVAVAHGGTIRAALGLALGMQPAGALAFAVDNLSVTRIDHIADDGGKVAWRVGAVNLPPGFTVSGG